MYRIVGVDQREYGPVDAVEVRQWIKDGRANARTIARCEDGAWKPLGTFPEFADVLPSSSTTGTGAPPPFGSSSYMTTASSGPRAHPLAITSLVLGCLGMIPCCCVGPLLGIVGAILGVISLVQIGQEPDRWTGKGLAIAGIVLSVLSFGVFALFLLLSKGSPFNHGMFRLL
ncbi:MAG: DUF4190 domain-containing protein [Pedosphaera sp.]|nr:DUF4190 domain-containing protein [Pedosphaera sp.]